MVLRPLVSIIITCHNYEPYVERAITSALSQQYENLEVIVVDDGSKDQSWKVISCFRLKIKAIRTENRGSVSACLAGFRASAGAYIMFLDADDLLDTKAFSAFCHFFDGITSKIQFCMQPIDAEGKFILTPFPDYNKDMSNQSLINSIKSHGSYTTPPTSGNIYRRDVYEQIGDLSYDVGIDGVAYLLAPFVGNVISIKQVLGYYRIHGNNMSGLMKITPERLKRESGVFLARLDHLDKLLDQLKIARIGFYPQHEYLYSTERDVYFRILTDQSLGHRLKISYITLVLNETTGVSRLLYLVYALSIITFAKFIARKLIFIRLDNSNRSIIRNFLKKNLTLVGQAAPSQ